MTIKWSSAFYTDGRWSDISEDQISKSSWCISSQGHSVKHMEMVMLMSKDLLLLRILSCDTFRQSRDPWQWSDWQTILVMATSFFVCLPLSKSAVLWFLYTEAWVKRCSGSEQENGVHPKLERWISLTVNSTWVPLWFVSHGRCNHHGDSCSET